MQEHLDGATHAWLVYLLIFIIKNIESDRTMLNLTIPGCTQIVPLENNAIFFINTFSVSNLPNSLKLLYHKILSFLVLVVRLA